ncbi:MAG: ribosome silencing factor [Ruminococcaceae bacterium]|nr:ribosome silencing factor [Oscillospiraceae bacterium]
MENILEIKEGCLQGATSQEVAELAVKILDSKLASEIKLLKIDAKTVIADYFVICTGRSTTQIKTLADEVEYKLKVAGVIEPKLEGSASDEWKIVDCKDVIIHIFSVEARDFYKLDRLWADCEEIDITKILNS